ncbi:peptidylprolyl isomerase [Thiotrichales bacterium 19S9-12]|nr:peptidylprolyl isomerase [Thiotrichales bacterium 19S9-11]MCF6811291.1 peptidylprolyl isomerase [Thiotrichales bacterium 19S9-12]
MSHKLISMLALSISCLVYSQGISADKTTNTLDTSKILSQIPQENNSTQDKNTRLNTKNIPFNQIIAVVNQDVITTEELNEAVEQTKAQLTDQGVSIPSDLTLKRQLLQQLINQKIMLDLAKKNHVTTTDVQVNDLIKSIAKANNISTTKLRKKLESTGIDYQQYFDTMRKQLIIQKMQQKLVSGSIFVSPNDIDNFVKKYLQKPDMVKYNLSNILIPLPKNKTPEAIQKAKNQANDLVKNIQSGKISFFDAARKYSQSANALSGGFVGEKTVDELPSIYAQKVESMKKGEVLGPFEANGALQILKLNDIKIEQADKHWVEEYHVQQILLKLTPILNSEQAKAQLERIIMALNNGESFASMAKSNTQNYDSASKGGDLGWLNLDKIDSTLAEMIEKTPTEQVSKPFKVGNTWQIIKVLGKRKTDNTEAYLKMQAANTLFRQRAEQMIKNWQLSLRGEAYINILIPEYKIPELDSQ